MSFDIDIRGLDELKRELEKMREGMTPSVVEDWCKRIESEAKENCPAKERDSIVIDAVPIEPDDVDIQFKSSEKALPYVRDAIQRNLPSMSVTTKAIFETLLKQVEESMSEGEGTE